MSELPEGWVDIEIGDITDVVAGGTPKANDASNFSEPGEGVAWLTPADLSGYKLKEISKGSRDLSQKGYDSCSAKLVPKGSLLFSSRAPIGYVAVAANEISTNQGFKNFVFPREINPSYAFYYLKSIRELANNLGTGTTFKELSGAKAKTLPFRLAPVNEQIRIAQKLDELLTQVDTLKVRIDAIPALLKHFRQSVLATAVSGQLTEEWRTLNQPVSINLLLDKISQERDDLKKSKRLKPSFGKYIEVDNLYPLPSAAWSWVCFDQISKNENNALKAGPFGSALKKSDCVAIGFKVYGQEQVISGDEGLSTYFIDKQKFKELESCRAEGGDILVSLVGTIGKVLILSEEAEVGIINPRLVKASLAPEISREYVKIYMDSIIAHDFFKQFSHGGTMEILNLGILKKLPIPLPPLAEQTEIVRRIEQLFAFADQLEAKVAAAKSRIDHLTQSILAKAFRGELVAQDPNDEPASVLLERIKAQRAATPKAKRGRKASV